MNPYTHHSAVAAEVEVHERSLFIQRTYMHVAFALLAFVIIEAILLQMPFAETMTRAVFGSTMSILIFFVAFIGITTLAENWACSDTSRDKQYLGLALYTVAEAIFFLPILWIANTYYPKIIPQAAAITLTLFAGLTFIAFTSKKDFTFLGGALKLFGFVAIGLILASIIFGYTLGIVFSGAMIVFAGACILYHTSAVLHRYRTDQYVAASLTLFSSVMLMFWYVLRFLMHSGDG